MFKSNQNFLFESSEGHHVSWYNIKYGPINASTCTIIICLVVILYTQMILYNLLNLPGLLNICNQLETVVSRNA